MEFVRSKRRLNDMSMSGSIAIVCGCGTRTGLLRLLSRPSSRETHFLPTILELATGL